MPRHIGLRRTKKYISDPEQGKIFPDREIQPAQAVRALYLFVRKSSEPKTHSSVATQGQHAASDCFPNNTYVVPQTLHESSTV